jgi:hypothetical protein
LVSKYATIPVTREVFERLKAQGVKGETWDQLVRRLAKRAGI